VAIMRQLDTRTNLVQTHSGSGSGSGSVSVSASASVGVGVVAGLSASGLRAYQWEGVSWLTQLRRCGLGGILAGRHCRR
jgi:hypothetical protein